MRLCWLSLVFVGGCGIGEPLVAPPPGDLVLEPGNVGTWSGALTVPDFEVAAETHLTIDWGALTLDVHGMAFDGAVDEVALVSTQHSREELLDLMVTRQWRQSDLTGTWLADGIAETAMSTRPRG